MASKAQVSQLSTLHVSFGLSGSFAFVASSKTITRATGSFITDGVLIGQVIETDKSGNLGPFTVTAVSATAITVTETVTDAAASTVALTCFQQVGEVNSLNTPAGEPGEIDVTHLGSTSREFRNGLRDEGSISGEMNFVPSDAGQKIMRAARSDTSPRKYRITIPARTENGTLIEGYRWTFLGLQRGMQASLSVDEKATQSFNIRVSGTPVEEVLSA